MRRSTPLTEEVFGRFGGDPLRLAVQLYRGQTDQEMLAERRTG